MHRLDPPFQIFLAPPTTNEDGSVKSPETVINELMSQAGYRFEVVPLSDKEVYLAAIEEVKLQGWRFEITDERSWILRIAEEGGVPEDKYLRVIKLIAAEKN